MPVWRNNEHGVNQGLQECLQPSTWKDNRRNKPLTVSFLGSKPLLKPRRISQSHDRMQFSLVGLDTVWSDHFSVPPVPSKHKA